MIGNLDSFISSHNLEEGILGNGSCLSFWERNCCGLTRNNGWLDHGLGFNDGHLSSLCVDQGSDLDFLDLVGDYNRLFDGLSVLFDDNADGHIKDVLRVLLGHSCDDLSCGPGIGDGHCARCLSRLHTADFINCNFSFSWNCDWLINGGLNSNLRSNADDLWLFAFFFVDSDSHLFSLGCDDFQIVLLRESSCFFGDSYDFLKVFYD